MYTKKCFEFLALALIIISCIKDFTTEAAPNIVRNASSTIDDDIDDFIPYQGERFNAFDWNIFKILAKKYSGNMLISPISTKLAMIYLYEGAQGKTAQELSTVMHLPNNRAVTRDIFTNIINSLQAKNHDYTLNIGTRIYIDSTIQLRQRYAAIVKMFYSTEVLSRNLSDTHATADSVNSWVKNITENNLDKLIDDESNLRGSVMIIVNALFFKGTWDKQPFSEKATRVGKFYPTAISSIDVPMMHSYGRFYYSSSSELDAKILRIPYSGHRYAMYFILPRKINELDSLVEKLNSHSFSRQMWLMQDLSLAVVIPKFKFDFTTHLETTLREMGIQDIFEPSATLTGILKTNRNSPQLIVSDIVQKSGIEVNEKGTAAYVATEIQLSNKIGEDNFVANRPFIFYIEDEKTGTILYMGRVENPLQGIGNTTIIPSFPTRLGEENDPGNVAVFPGVEERYNFFNIELLQDLNDQFEGNLVAAPSGVKAALMTISEGSGGQTRQQLLSTLRLPVDDYGVRDAVRRTLSPFAELQLSGINNTEIIIATSLWIGKNVVILPEYKENLINHYNSHVLSVDFSDDVTCVKTINDWIKNTTNNHISSIVDSDFLSSYTQVLLTSSLYFKGTWLYAFDEKLTRPRCFKTFENGCHEVHMMENFGLFRFAYVPSLDAEAIEIPYTGGKISMIIMLPSRQGAHALQILSKDLSYIPVSVMLRSLRVTEVLLQIPKFSIENKLDLRPALERLGVKDLFNFKANLSGIISKEPIKVSSVLHNAKIEVNEAGTIAAAETAIPVVPLMITSPSQAFRVNRPFLFGLVDLETNNLIFAGRVIFPDVISKISTKV